MSYFLRSRAVRSLPCSVKAHVGMEPHAKTPLLPVSSPEVTAILALELLASVSARTHVSDTEFEVEPVSILQPQTMSARRHGQGGALAPWKCYSVSVHYSSYSKTLSKKTIIYASFSQFFVGFWGLRLQTPPGFHPWIPLEDFRLQTP